MAESPKVTSGDYIAARVQAAISARDLTTLAPVLVDDVRWASCVGKAQVLEWMQAALARAVDVTVYEATALPDRVIVHVRVRSAERRSERDLYQVLFIDDDKVVEVAAFDTRDEAVAASPSPSQPRWSTTARLASR